MYVVGSLADTATDAGPFAGHSEGLVRRPIVDRSAGSVHQAMTICELAPGGWVDAHLHAFEEAFYVLSGRVAVAVVGTEEELAADDYCFLEKGVAHGLRNGSSERARWLEVSAPQPEAALEDTVFGARGLGADDVELAFRRARFEASELPPPSDTIGLAGFGAANVGGASLEILVGRDFGASQLNLMVVQYAPGGAIKEHDHAFEEGFFFVEGEIEAELEGTRHTVRAGDFFWSGVGSMHALVNRSSAPVRWLETQVPQPPSRHQARFRADWERLLAGA